jgi:hypothetical protein
VKPRWEKNPTKTNKAGLVGPAGTERFRIFGFKVSKTSGFRLFFLEL